MKSQTVVYVLVFLISLVGMSSMVLGATPLDMRKSILATSDTFAFISEKIKPGVVYIDVKKKTEATKKTDPTKLFLNDPDLEHFFGSYGNKHPIKPPAAPTYSRGSGFVISTAGHTDTANK